jgi:lysophospholipase L1-like esterase
LATLAFKNSHLSSYTFDLYSIIPYANADEDTREKLWDDGLHLTIEGYKLMGDAIAVGLFDILQGSQLPPNIDLAAK